MIHIVQAQCKARNLDRIEGVCPDVFTDNEPGNAGQVITEEEQSRLYRPLSLEGRKCLSRGRGCTSQHERVLRLTDELSPSPHKKHVQNSGGGQTSSTTKVVLSDLNTVSFPAGQEDAVELMNKSTECKPHLLHEHELSIAANVPKRKHPCPVRILSHFLITYSARR